MPASLRPAHLRSPAVLLPILSKAAPETIRLSAERRLPLLRAAQHDTFRFLLSSDGGDHITDFNARANNTTVDTLEFKVA